MFRTILLLGALVCVGCAPAQHQPAAPPTVQPSLQGKYDFHAEVPGEGSVSGQSWITPRGQTYDLSRSAVGGGSATGFGLQIDHVLGAVIVPYPRRFYPALGLVIYRIEGGMLKGFRLPEIDEQRQAGREELAGSPGLNGRYEITLSENPYGQPYYQGFVEIVRHGEAYLVRWYTPGLAYRGIGVRLGDVFIAAYSQNAVPGVLAYCVGADGLVGVGARADRPTLSTQSMRRAGSPLPPAGPLRGPCP